MELEFFDTNVFLGNTTKKPVFKTVVGAHELLKKMDKSNVKKVLVWHIAQYELSSIDGNSLLNRAIAGEKRLFGCWSILPEVTGEVITENFFKEMKKNRIFALRIFPDFHRFLVNRITFPKFMDEITRRRIPLLLSLERGISWQGVYQIMKEFPRLTCILCDIGSWGVNRYTWPLLENYPNFYVETSMLSLSDQGIETTVKKFGAKRLIFGSGFPSRYFEAPVLQLIHSNISESEKKKIAHLNLERIIRGVKL